VNYVQLGVNALILLSVWRSRKKSMREAKATRQHVTKQLHAHRMLTTGGDKNG
jgi:hypothetical protein